VGGEEIALWASTGELSSFRRALSCDVRRPKAKLFLEEEE